MKRLAFPFIFTALFILTSCQHNESTKASQSKADSLEKQTEHAMDSAYEENMKKMNAVDDSLITNDVDTPEKN